MISGSSRYLATASGPLAWTSLIAAIIFGFCCALRKSAVASGFAMIFEGMSSGVLAAPCAARTTYSSSLGAQTSSPSRSSFTWYGATTPGGISSSRYIVCTTMPRAHSSAIPHSTTSPTLKRSARTASARRSGVSRHSLNPCVSLAGSRFFPMKTRRDCRGSPSAHGVSKWPSIVMCTAWKTYRCDACAIASTPFIR